MRKSLGMLLLCAVSFSAVWAAPVQPPVQTKDAPPPAPKIKVGDTAPDFTIKNQEGKDVKLSSFRGKRNVVLAFYLFAFTSG